MPTEEERTFNEAMNEWAAKQSFFHDTRNRLVHPDPSLPLPFRMIGYLFRLAIVALLLWFIAGFFIKLYASGKGFGEMMGEKTAELLSAESFEASRYTWKGDRASTKLFTASGSNEAFFKELSAYSASFELPKNRLFKKAWKLDNLRVSELDVLLRVGSSAEVSANASPALRRLAAGFGINPDLRQLDFDQIEIDDGTFRWGVSASTRGNISNAPLQILPPDPKGGEWTLNFTGGSLSQNWWRDIGIESLKVQTLPNQLVFSEGRLRFPRGGTGTLSGELKFGEPHATVQLDVKDAALENFCPPDFHRFVGGIVDASISIDGSPNTLAGIGSEATLEIREATLRRIPVLLALSMLLESTRIRQLPLTSGTVSLATGDRIRPEIRSKFRNVVLEVTEINAVSEGVGRLRGNFTVRKRERLKVSDQADLGSIEREAAATGASIEDWTFEGDLQFGVETARFEALRKPAAEGLFELGADGLSWIEIPLEGNIQEITKALHDRIVSAIRKAE